MASGNRDLTIGLVTNLNRFDLKAASNEFDDLGDAAKGAGKEVERGLEAGEKGVKGLSREAESARADLNAFFDKMGSGAKQAGREVNQGMDRAGEGLQDFKQEANQTARESAASFSGSFEDAADAVQETLANALSGFGPIGAAVGIAAAAGLGTLLSKFNEAKEKAQELRRELVGLMIEGSGTITSESLLGRIREMAEDGTLEDLRKRAKDANISLRDLVRGQAGDLEANKRLNAELSRRIDLLKQDENANSQQIDRYRDLQSMIQTNIEVLGIAAEIQSDYASVTQGLGDAAELTAEKVQGYQEAIESATSTQYSENIDTIAQSLRNAGEASDEFSQKISENEGKLTASDVLAILKEQTEAALNHQKHLQLALEEGGQAFAAWMAGQPAEVAAAYADGSAAQRAAIRAAAAKNVGAAMGEGAADGLVGSAPTISTAANTIYNTAKSRLTGRPIMIPVGVDGPSVAQVDAVYSSIKRRFGTITIPVVPKQFGQGRFIP